MTTPAAVADALTKESYSSNNNGNNHDEVLRYRHSKHAGNHGDVLKHAILVELLLSLLEETPKIVFVDTHAGTGKYTLSKDGEEARKGILKLMADNCECIQMSPSLQDYLSLVQSFQPQDHQTKNDSLEYPGSPLLVQTILKTYAKKYWHYSFEWNPSQYGWLQKSLSTSTSSNTNIYNTDSGSVIIQCSDGYEGAVNVLEQATAGSSNNPKQENEQQKHMVIFIDPPYKDLVRECSQVEKTVQKLLQLHTGCTIMVWIPNLPSPLDPEEYVPKLIERLKETARQFHNNKNNDDPLHWLHASLQVKCSKDQRKGLLGSSMWVVNPPIGFSSNFLMSLAGLSECLKQNCSHYQLETD